MITIGELTNKGAPALADKMEIEDGSTQASYHITLTQLQVLLAQLADAVNISLGTTTGTKIGTATTQNLGFWNATPIVQPASADQAALTDSTGGTADGTLEAVGATNGSDVSGAINNNFKELFVQVNEIRNVLVNTGIMKGAA